MKNSPRRIAVALAGATLLGLATPLAASAAASATYLYNCSTRVQHPREIVLTCADANTYVTAITWSQWSSPRARATGILHWNTCTPTCVAGQHRSAPIHFVATDRRRVKGVWLYTVLAGTAGTWRTGSATFALPTSPL